MKYVAPEMKVLELAATDVIVCSSGGGDPIVTPRTGTNPHLKHRRKAGGTAARLLPFVRALRQKGVSV